jgi:adenylate kinase
MKDIVIMWIQWSGKWVQSRLILEKYSKEVDYFEMWWILRDISRWNNVLGKYIKSCVHQWNLVSDEFAAGIFDLFIQTLWDDKHALLDWYPRTPEQLKLFLKVMKARNREFVVFCLCLDKDVSISRIVNRRICKDCGEAYNLKLHWDIKNCTKCNGDLYQREDEKDMSVVDRRVQQYIDVTKPLIDEFEKEWFLVKLDANRTIKEISNDINKFIRLRI